MRTLVKTESAFGLVLNVIADDSGNFYWELWSIKKREKIDTSSSDYSLPIYALQDGLDSLVYHGESNRGA